MSKRIVMCGTTTWLKAGIYLLLRPFAKDNELVEWSSGRQYYAVILSEAKNLDRLGNNLAQWLREEKE